MAQPIRTLDIHSYERQTRQSVDQLHRSTIGQRNKDLILAYRDACLVKGTCGYVRLIRVVGALKLFAQLIKKDFDTLTRPDIERLISILLARRPAYSAETLGTYRAILKNFITWLHHPDEFPHCEPPRMVAWLRSHVRTKDKRRLHRNELLTPSDIQALLGVCHNPRDKALISLLWETGGRIAELGNLQLSHVAKHEHGYLLDLYGKTGHRNPLVVSSGPFLSQWLANHPFAANPDAPLWVHYQYTTEITHLKYDTIRTLLRRYFERAGIAKPFHPHIFRHSRATHVLATGLMGEQACKTYFGWSPNSQMLATYSHLVDQDANNAILHENRLATARPVTDQLAPQPCTICNTLNQQTAQYCVKCSNPLNESAAHRAHEQAQSTHELVLRLAAVLVKKGLLDEAAEQIHTAGLGSILKTLATTERPAR